MALIKTDNMVLTRKETERSFSSSKSHSCPKYLKVKQGSSELSKF